MTAKLHYGITAPATVAGASPASGYPASNAALPQIGRPYVSTLGNGSAETLTYDFGSNKTIVAVGLQSFLQASCFIFRGAFPVDFIVGTATSAIDRHGVSKASTQFTGSPARYLDANITLSSSVKATGVYSVEQTNKVEFGAMYAFASSLDLPVQALLGSSVEYEYPEQTDNLPNGQTVTHKLGAPFATIKLDFLADGTQDIERIARIARSGICWLDLGLADRRELQWPVRFIDAKHTRALSPQTKDKVTLTFREIT